MLNPYAKYLGTADPLATISASPRIVKAIIRSMSLAALNYERAPGKWSVRDIVCHLSEVELAFAFRLRQAAAAPDHLIQPFDQDAWAKNSRHTSCPSAHELFESVRRSNVDFIRRLPTEIFATTVTHPERGAMTFQDLVETMAGHDINHIWQIEALASSAPNQ